jgi:multidrug transporter EmrE-like cation transporter
MRAAAIVAPAAAVVGTVTPVIFGILWQGAPTIAPWLGFAAGAMGIWLVSRSPMAGTSGRNRSLLLAVLSGVFIGGFLILLAQVKAKDVFSPLVISKATGAPVGYVVLLALRMPAPSFRRSPIAMLAGVLDAGGNVLFIWSSRWMRLDVAAVLASMAPVVTVLLSCWIFREIVSRTQWAGVMLCLLAVVLLAVQSGGQRGIALKDCPILGFFGSAACRFKYTLAGKREPDRPKGEGEKGFQTRQLHAAFMRLWADRELGITGCYVWLASVWRRTESARPQPTRNAGHRCRRGLSCIHPRSQRHHQAPPARLERATY